MDLVTLGFLALIALVSGGIAYFADWLGRHLGKKRLRLGGLRPRHTAGVFVVSSGIVISLLTIGIVSFLSSDVREWLKKGNEAIRELKDVVKQRDEAVNENKRILQQNETLKEEGLRRQGEIDQAETTLKKITLRTQDLQSQNQRFQLAARELHRKLDSVQQEFLTSSQSLHSTEQQRMKVAHSLEDVSKQLSALNERYLALNQSWTELSRQSKDIEQYNTRLTGDNMRLTASNKDLELKGRDLQARNDIATRELDRLKQEIDLKSAELEGYAEKIRVDNDILGKLDNVVIVGRERPMTFAAHEELARWDVPAHATPDEARDAITNLLREARSKAEQRGAKSTGPNTPCAAIFPHSDPRSHRDISPDEIAENMVRRITGRPTELVLVASSTLNAFEGEPVSVDLKEYPNPLIYRRGQVIAETHIDRNEDDATILTRINELLRQKVHERAKKDNLIPDSHDSFGDVDAVEVHRIANAVQMAGRPVRLQAVAREDTRAGDPLQIDLRIR